MAKRYQSTWSRPEVQSRLNARNMFRPRKHRQVGLIFFHVLRQVTRSRLSIVGIGVETVLAPTPRSLEEMERTFADRSLASQLACLRRGAQPGISFPILVRAKVEDLGPMNWPDAFIGPKNVSLASKQESEAVSAHPGNGEEPARVLFHAALEADRELQTCVWNTCAVCQSSGLTKLSRCAKFRVARYRGKEHQAQHRREHRTHCKRSLALWEETGFTRAW